MIYPKLGFTVGGTASAPVTLSGFDPLYLIEVSGGGVDSGIWINANHVVVRNFNVTAPGSYPGISIAPHRHHVTIADNVIHDAGGNDINVIFDDYVTILRNVIHGNAPNTTWAFNSGVSIKTSVDVDTSTGVKMVVDSNIVHSNINVPNCSTPQCLATASNSDGNGIIMDTNSLQAVPYGGAFLVTNNVVYNNGGRGIYVYKSNNATITNNTAFKNNRDPYLAYWHPGEIGADHGGNVGIYNDIVCSDGLNGASSTPAAPQHACRPLRRVLHGRRGSDHRQIQSRLQPPTEQFAAVVAEG